MLYVGSFSTVLFPGLRLGYVVAPSAMIERLAATAEALGLPPPLLHQAAVADFIASGHFGRHIRRMRGLYAARRAALRSMPGAQIADPPPGLLLSFTNLPVEQAADTVRRRRRALSA